MGTRELTPATDNKSAKSKGVFDHSKKDEAPVVRHDSAQADRGAGGASPQDHLAKLSGSQSSHSSRRSQYVLQLQRRYGNRYVQRVLGQARKTDRADEVLPDTEDTIERSRGGGSALDTKTRLQMESAFGADFSGVRVHTGGQADALKRAVNARAFTTGRDVFFREGEFRPGSSSGRELLAHELTHVVQQGAGIQSKPAIRQPGEEADKTEVAREAPPAQEQQPRPAPKSVPAAGAKAQQEGVPSTPGAQAPSVKPAAEPLAAPPEKSTAGPVSGKPSAGGAETKAGTPEAAVTPSEAIAPAISAVRHRAAGAGRHRAASAPVASAQAAARDPKTEQTRAAAEQTVAKLDAAKEEAGQVKRKEFKDKLKRAIEAATSEPKSESEAKEVMETGAAKASNALRGELATERDAATGPMAVAASPQAEVPPSSQPAPPKTDLQPEDVGPPPAPVAAAPIVPAPLPPERLDYSSDRAPTDQMMAENDVSKEQLEEGNEPAFGPALQGRATAEQHEATAEARYRQVESKVQGQAKGAAEEALAQGLAGIHDARAQKIGQVIGQQLATKSKDAAERQRITDRINEIKNKTRADVNSILNEMEAKAAEVFEAGLKRAEKAYEDTFEEAKGGIGTWLTTWGEDWEELIEDALATARREYLNQVDIAIDQVADLVEAKLAEAKKRVADGRKEVDEFVKGLDDSVKRYGEEALEAVTTDFDAMGTDIDQRRDGLIDKLTQQYKASYERMSAMEEKLREENKSLWQRVYDATVGLIEKILAFKDMLLGILGRAAAVIVDIIAHPIRFLGDLVSGIKQGLQNFMEKIGFFLQKGLMEWLFGALAGTGLQLPEKFDLEGIVSIVFQILGLTYAKFRARAVALVGEPVVAALERAAEVFKVFLTEGIPGLWRFIKGHLTDLKSMVLDAIFDFIKERVIIAGITWIIGLLNPASAFFKACKAIYDIVMFFINCGSQILALVNAVVDSIAAIAKGALSTAVGLVEGALAKSIPVAIGFLAGLLGLGDPTAPVRTTIEKARSPVEKAIDWVINLAVKGVRAAGKLVGGLFDGKTKFYGGTGEDKQERLTKGMAAGVAAINQVKGDTVPGAVAKAKLITLRLRYRLPVLEAVAKSGRWYVHGEIQRAEEPTDKKEGSGDDDKKKLAEQEKAAVDQALKDLDFIKTTKDLNKKYRKKYDNAQDNSNKAGDFIAAADADYDKAIQHLGWAKKTIEELKKTPELEARDIQERAETLGEELSAIYSRVNSYADRLVSQMDAPEHAAARETIETLRADLTRKKAEHDKARSVLSSKNAKKEALEAAITEFGSIKTQFADIEKHIADVHQKAGFKLSKESEEKERAWDPNQTIEKQLVGMRQLAALERMPGDSLTPLTAKLVRESTPVQLEAHLDQLVRDGKITENRKDQLIHTIHKFFEKRDLRHGK